MLSIRFYAILKVIHEILGKAVNVDERSELCLIDRLNVQVALVKTVDRIETAEWIEI